MPESLLYYRLAPLPETRYSTSGASLSLATKWSPPSLHLHNVLQTRQVLTPASRSCVLWASLPPPPQPPSWEWALGLSGCQPAVNPARADQLMSDQGAGGQPIKSCQMRKQVGARWTAAGHRESEMASRAVSGYLLCAVAPVFLVLLQGTQSVYIQVCPEGPPGERLGWRRNAGKLTKDSPGPKAQPNTQSHHRGQKSRWVEAAGMPVTRMTVMITINDAHSALLSSSAHPGQRSDGELDIVSALEPRRRGRLL